MRIPRCDVVLASVPLLTAMALGGVIAAVGARPNRPKNSVTANKLLKDRIFSDFLWTMRSLYLPLFTILKSRVEEADLYHSVSNGYAGVWGSLQSVITGNPFLMTEHGVEILSY